MRPKGGKVRIRGIIKWATDWRTACLTDLFSARLREGAKRNQLAENAHSLYINGIGIGYHFRIGRSSVDGGVVSLLAEAKRVQRDD